MEKIQVSMILEILGRPKDHVKEALNTLVVKLGAEKGVNILNKNYNEPKLAEGAKDLFTTFAEVEAEFETIDTYFMILFAYLPSHIEIIHPEKLAFMNFEFNELGNKITARMHDYDAITKKTIAERDFVLQKLQEAAPDIHKQITTPPETKQEPPKKPKKK
ncbi:hypothetical protein CMI47_00175 [Candidatus Pacearchaeota archaeon]|nr:hypothetical protein [Candidatus Pacearchaeota archaeon]|tara:strand:- start:24021 stop:24503 length:483 start_codon:yes stop_codon:yes gene_type:complete